MKIYIAGKLETEFERKMLEKIDLICKSAGFSTFLPHRDVGLAENIKQAKEIFEEDILNGFKDCDLVVAFLDGLTVGAGTAWELGYSYAKKVPIIGVKTDEPVEDAFTELSSILIASMPIVSSFEELEKKLAEFKINRRV
jgi:nucleoside 2-deoxyribosyltransferase